MSENHRPSMKRLEILLSLLQNLPDAFLAKYECCSSMLWELVVFYPAIFTEMNRIINLYCWKVFFFLGGILSSVIYDKMAS